MRANSWFLGNRELAPPIVLRLMSANNPTHWAVGFGTSLSPSVKSAANYQDAYRLLKKVSLAREWARHHNRETMHSNNTTNSLKMC